MAFSAFRLWRALVDRDYRSRALFTGVGGLSVIFFALAQYADSVFGQVPTTYTGVLVEDGAWGFVFLGLFGWIVTNANVAMSADFFNRDAFYWKRGGRIAAPVIIFVTYFVVSLPPWWMPQSIESSSFFNSLVSTGFGGPIIYAGVVLAVTYFRIKDPRIKRYTLWVALSILSVVAFLAFSSAVNSDIGLVFIVLWVFFLYRSVRTLAITTRTLGAESTVASAPK